MENVWTIQQHNIEQDIKFFTFNNLGWFLFLFDILKLILKKYFDILKLILKKYFSGIPLNLREIFNYI